MGDRVSWDEMVLLARRLEATPVAERTEADILRLASMVRQFQRQLEAPIYRGLLRDARARRTG